MSEAERAGTSRQDESERLLAGRYRLGAVLGRGGMGTVWRAEDETLGRTVAVKELRFPSNIDEDEKRRLITRTLREAKAIARIRNNSAVTVFDVVDEDDRPWIVMELIEGKSLAEVIREDGLLTPVRAAEVGLAILDVLRSAHLEGILHRDVKPSNVLIAEDGRVVLTDFGIAQVEGDPSITSTGMLVGAPSYISPERARGHKPGPAADLWSLGGLLYAAVEGVPPYDKGSAIATLTAVMTEPLEEPRHAGPLRDVIHGLLTKDPAKRLDDAGARALLTKVIDGADPKAAPGPEPLDATKLVPLPPQPDGRSAKGGQGGSGGRRGEEAAEKLRGALRSVRKAAVAAGGAAAKTGNGGAADGATGTAASGATGSGAPAVPGARPSSRGPAAPGAPGGPAGGAGGRGASVPGPAPAGRTPAGPAPAGPASAGSSGARSSAPRPAVPRPSAPAAGAAVPGAAALGSAGAPASAEAGGTGTGGTQANATAGARSSGWPVMAPPEDLPDLPPRTVPRAPITDVVPRRTLVIVAVVVVLAVVGTVLAITLGGDDSGGKGKTGNGAKASVSASAGASSAGASAKEDKGGDGAVADGGTSGSGTGSTGSTPDQTESVSASGGSGGGKSGSGVGAAVTTYRSSQGFSIGLPSGWKYTTTDSAGARFTGPDGQKLLVAWTSTPQNDPVADWRNQERYMTRSQYTRIRIESVDYRGWKAADWEFTHVDGGVKYRTIDRGFVVNDHLGQALMYTAKAADWDSALRKNTWKTLTTSFEPKS